MTEREEMVEELAKAIWLSVLKWRGHEGTLRDFPKHKVYYDWAEHILATQTKTCYVTIAYKQGCNKLPENVNWQKVEREFEAWSAGQNSLLQAGYVQEVKK